MAMSAAAVFAGYTTKTWDITATADADTGTLNVAHGFTAAPKLTFLTELLAAAHVSNWVVSAIDATNVTLTKTSTGAGSGNASAQVRLTAMLPHSIIS